MRVIVVADRIGEHGRPAVSPTAAVAHGWSSAAPHDEVDAVTLTDGGAGFVDAMDSVSERTDPVVVPGPYGGSVPAQIAWRGNTAYVEVAHVVGRHLDERGHSALDASSAGVAELLVTARDAGAQRIVVGVGSDVVCHDGGLGLLLALGAGTDLSGLPGVCRQWAGVTLVMATASMVPLTGFHGASAALVTERGVSAHEAQEHEARLGRFTEVVDDALRQSSAPTVDLLTGATRRRERQPGAGSGGGVGYALQILGAATLSGTTLALDELAVRQRLVGALVVLATERYDWRSVADGVVAETARAALEVASPTVVLAREVLVGRREGMSLGISGTYSVRAGESWEALSARVARTWSPPPRRPTTA
ncbi:MAG: glycerate kinase [Ornithinimicrobium sp.]